MEIIKVVIISLAIIIPVRYFLIQPFYVKGASMEPSFHDHEYLIINEITYRINEPQRGDIIVFRYPKDPSQYFIKRIIGLPGEKIKIKDGKIFIYNSQYENGIELTEQIYLPDELETPNLGKTEYILENDQYFVLGDNREASLDSRRFGPVPRRLIIGKAWIRGWPFDKITIFKSPAYNF
ncbi:MAG: signal peptidase I [Candidatus Buchananbacteria bacterium RBG_13_36_9]|uniref:Signal peptidase I n=1 Tax=Candidatus Buchananbacteria bacterium RBG_13_36_9 TaxID=1797530 RepID=A0A1G1XQG9_9BACT|nr:MAG: signal peptidase I [Candidatus Buchananbacteria bacterium RBG_13_36_9]